MLTQCPDSPNDMHPIAVAIRQRARQRYYVEVPARPLDEQSRLIDHLIGLAFDTLGARHLDVLVLGLEPSATCAASIEQVVKA